MSTCSHFPELRTAQPTPIERPIVKVAKSALAMALIDDRKVIIAMSIDSTLRLIKAKPLLICREMQPHEWKTPMVSLTSANTIIAFAIVRERKSGSMLRRSPLTKTRAVPPISSDSGFQPLTVNYCARGTVINRLIGQLDVAVDSCN